MTSILLLFSLGILVVGYLPTLPPFPNVVVFFALFLASCCCVRHKGFFILPLAFTLGLTYGIFSGHQYITQQLADDWVAQDILVEGKVIDLPEEDRRRQQFIFAVAKAQLLGDSADTFISFPKKISLSSYGKLRVKAGEEWRLLVKVKKPRGFVNPGGFDYQVSLLRRGIGAAGYIRSSTLNQLVQSQSSFSIVVLRYQLQQWLMQKSQSPHKSILVALLVGDTSLLDKQSWKELQQTGTTHLIAIKCL